jgi:hypothetical protein
MRIWVVKDSVACERAHQTKPLVADGMRFVDRDI